MLLSIIVPCYNEEDTIGSVLEKLVMYNFGYAYEIIVVDDGSADSSPDIINSYLHDPHIVFLQNHSNLGKTRSIVKGLQIAQGKYITIRDADQEYSVEDIDSLVLKAVHNNYGILYGTRTFYTKNSTSLYNYGNILLTGIFNLLYKQSITDLTTCYKLIKRSC